jgi:hypothetical protein
MRQVPKGDAGSAPAIRVVTGTDSVSCGNDEILAGFVCASGATDGAKCATPAARARAATVRQLHLNRRSAAIFRLTKSTSKTEVHRVGVRLKLGWWRCEFGEPTR